MVTVVLTSRLAMVGVYFNASAVLSSTTDSMLGLRSSWISRSGFTCGVSFSLMPTSSRSMFWMKSRSEPEPSTEDFRMGMFSTTLTDASRLFCAHRGMFERIFRSRLPATAFR